MRRAVLAIATVFAVSACAPGGNSSGDDDDPIMIPGDDDSGVLADGGAGGADGSDAAGPADADIPFADMTPPPEPDAGTPPPTEGLEVIVLEDVAIESGYSEMLEVELPDDVQSLTIIGLGDDTLFHGVVHLEGPDGTILIAEQPPGVQLGPFDSQLAPWPGPFRSANRSISAATGIGTALAPNNPQVAVSPGTWTYQLASLGQFGPTTTTLDVILYIKSGPQQERGVLDMHLHFSGSRGWTAATAPDDAQVQASIDRMAEFYEEIGIRLGEITYNDVDERFRAVDSGPMGPGAAAANSTLHELYSQCEYETGVCLFFVDRIGDGGFGGAIGGIAGGTPGPMLIPGTVRSGVVVATELDPDPRAIGHIMGHETGHFLGLYHTSEFIPGINDQIPDTPEGQGGDDNLMFPTVTAQPASLSPGQGFVMHNNPAVVPDQEAE